MFDEQQLASGYDTVLDKGFPTPKDITSEAAAGIQDNVTAQLRDKGYAFISKAKHPNKGAVDLVATRAKNAGWKVTENRDSWYIEP